MAEIKSTLDLVMEKTRHLQLSSQEKQQQQADTFRKKLGGLLLQYAGAIQDVDQFAREFQVLKRSFEGEAERMLQDEILERLKLEQPGGRLLDLLRDFCRIDTEKLKSTLEAYRHALEAGARKRGEQIKAELAKSRRIAGGAVVPNLDGDRQWASAAESVRQRFDRMLQRQKALLKMS